jgi:hypothetical protein
MVARKSLLRRLAPRPELERLLKASIAAGVSEEELQEQRISFAYGNAPAGSGITKESVRLAAKSLRLFPR